MSEARAAVLGRVREALSDIPPSETPEIVKVERQYLTTDPNLDAGRRIALFVERVSEYRAQVYQVDARNLNEAIAAACSRRGIRTLVVPADLHETWIPEGITVLKDHLLTDEQLNESDGVLTGCAIGIAQTGTIVLDRGPMQGRRALTLLPDYHLCVIREDQIVGIVPEAVAALQGSAGRPDRPMTWISGPSATSDIELNRVEGVHGPRTLEVIVVTSSSE